MKSLSEQIHGLDRENFRRVAHGMPEVQDARQPVQQAEQVAVIFNSLFAQLRAAFPAAVATIRTQAEFDEIRRQWLLALGEAGITSMNLVDAGMRVARRQEKPFLPSPGQFVAWCRNESAAVAGLPTTQELVSMVYQYSRNRGFYDDAESYPWASNADYWMVTTLYSQMRSQSLTDMQLCKKAAEEIAVMTRRISAGETIPEPTKRLPVLGGKTLSREQALARIADIRRQHGLRGGLQSGK